MATAEEEAAPLQFDFLFEDGGDGMLLGEELLELYSTAMESTPLASTPTFQMEAAAAPGTAVSANAQEVSSASAEIQLSTLPPQPPLPAQQASQVASAPPPETTETVSMNPQHNQAPKAAAETLVFAPLAHAPPLNNPVYQAPPPTVKPPLQKQTSNKRKRSDSSRQSTGASLVDLEKKKSPPRPAANPKTIPNKTSADPDYSQLAREQVASLIAKQTRQPELVMPPSEPVVAAPTTAPPVASPLVPTPNPAAALGLLEKQQQATTGGAAAVTALSAGANAAIAAPTSAAVHDNNDGSKQLTAEERLNQRRARNKKHARLTRLKKKAFEDELIKTLQNLAAQRDRDLAVQQQEESRLLELKNIRYCVMEEFLKLRVSNEHAVTRWTTILEDDFTLTVPWHNGQEQRKQNSSSSTTSSRQSHSTVQTLRGVDQIMGEANGFWSFMRAVVLRANRGMLSSIAPPSNNSLAITFQYKCHRDTFFMDGPSAHVEWQASYIPSVHQQFAVQQPPRQQNGLPKRISVKGVLIGKFNPATNKMISTTVSFDTGALARELMHASAAAAAQSNNGDNVTDGAGAAKQRVKVEETSSCLVQNPLADRQPSAATAKEAPTVVSLPTSTNGTSAEATPAST